MTRIAGLFIAAPLMAVALAAAPQSAATQQKPHASMNAEQVIAAWKAVPQDVAKKMLAKYGQPQEVTANRLVWHNNGPWKFTQLVNEEIPHDFPMPHKDALYQAINYRIAPDKADELLQYDGSLLLERTKGEIGARCDKQDANFLAINLANDVATGKRSVDDARKFYAESMMAMMKQNKKNEYLQGFIFKVPTGEQGDRDKPFDMPTK
ncbi:MAG: hypothetical protein H0T71_13450 [Acidobacteria bacterium]|nr:hypothetical protein [Acidobacteriota bacterium]